MALVKAVSGSKLLIAIGNGASPEVFAHGCTINGQRAISLQAETNDFVLPDCDAPEAMAWLSREKRALGATISGEGVLNSTDLETYFQWFVSADGRNVRTILDVTGANGGGYMAGRFLLTALEVSGNRGEKVSVSLTLLSDGVVAWTDAA